MSDRPKFVWMDLLWLAFLAGLAVLEPIREPHKQMILAAIGVVQIFERRLIGWIGFERGRVYMVLIKIGLATLLLPHTAEVPINSSYYLIYYLPVITAAMYFGPLATVGWTAAACGAYCYFLVLALQDYNLDWEAASELILRNLFFFLVARSEEHTSELQSLTNLVCRLLLEKKKNNLRAEIFVHHYT